MPRRIIVQNGSVMSKTMTPTVWLRLLRKERANWLGRYPSFCAARLDPFLGDRRDVARQRRIVQNDRDRGRRKSALLRHITNRHHGRILRFWNSSFWKIGLSSAFAPCRLN